MTSSKTLERVLKTCKTDLESLAAEAPRFQTDVAYLASHYRKLRTKHGPVWIAIYGSKVVAEAKDHDGLLDALREKGFEPRRILTWFFGAPDLEIKERPLAT